jgi:fatty acid desaturase
MGQNYQKRDYRLSGPENKRAQEKRYANAEWYTSPVPRKRLKELMQRKNGPAIRDTLIWLALLIGSGFAAYYSWNTWWAIPGFALYGILYSTPGVSRWHECGHGTAFKTPWMNNAVYQLASFMCLFPATPWRWSHIRHHTDTIIVGRDPEIAAPRPPVWHILIIEIFRIWNSARGFKRVLVHCFGKLNQEEKDYIPTTAYNQTFWESRIWTLIFLGVIISCIQTHSILPAMLVVLPTFYGSFLIAIFSLIQHLGLKEDVLDHRLNTRTVYMNPFFRFLYWNMNYHIEHHMFPMVPYHALPILHEELKFDFPQPSPSVWAAVKEVTSALLKQRKDPEYAIVRPLPDTANPYRFGPLDQQEATSVGN